MDQSETLLFFFFLKPFRDDLTPGFPRALDLSPRHAQKSSWSRLRNSMQPKLASRHVRIIAYWRNVWWRKVVPVCHLAEPLHWLKTRQRCHRESPLYYRCPPGEKTFPLSGQLFSSCELILVKHAIIRNGVHFSKCHKDIEDMQHDTYIL